MSKFLSSGDLVTLEQLNVLRDGLAQIAAIVGSALSPVHSNMQSVISGIDHRLDEVSRKAYQMVLEGRGPRASAMRMIHGQDAPGGGVIERTIQFALPEKLTEVDDLYRKRTDHPGSIANNILSCIRLGDRHGYHRWCFSDKGEDFGTLYTNRSIDDILRDLSTARDGIYRSRIGDQYNRDGYSLVLVFNNGVRNKVVVFIGSVSARVDYYVYVGLEDMWVHTHSPAYVDEKVLNKQMLALFQTHGIERNLELTMEQVFESVYLQAQADQIECSEVKALPPVPTDYSGHERLRNFGPTPDFQWSKENFLVGEGENITLSMRIGNGDVLQFTRSRRDGCSPMYRFNTGTQSLLSGQTPAGWDELPIRIRRQILTQYMSAIAATVAARPAAQETPEPAPALAEA